jgi:hypothetical protein
MPILPQTALFVILQCWSLVLQLVSIYWYERQLARYQDHWLVHLAQIADLSRLEQACAGFQTNNHPSPASAGTVDQIPVPAGPASNRRVD